MVKKGIGIALIAFGMFAGLVAAGNGMGKPEARGKEGKESKDNKAVRFGEALGGACCAIVPFLAGVFLLLSSGKRNNSERRTHEETWEYENTDEDDLPEALPEPTPPPVKIKGTPRRTGSNKKTSEQGRTE